MSKDKLAQVFHFDLYGKREDKYDFLNDSSIESINWNNLQPDEQYAFFVPKDFETRAEFESGFKIDELFLENVAGIETIRDAITIHFNSGSLKSVINDFLILDETEIANKYNTTDARDWKIGRAKEDVRLNIENQEVWQDIYYRPFDTRKTFYSGKQNGFVCNGRYNIMKHLLKDNLGLIVPRQTIQDYRHSFITKKIFEGNITASAKLLGTGCGFPLYIYPKTNSQLNIGESQNRVPNLNMEIVNQIAEKAGLYFQPEQPDYSQQTEETNQFYPIFILDYIYAVLHSPAYREKYKEFLKIDFPRVPYPTDPKQFYDLVDLGSQIRELHLLESPETENYITQYPIDGDNMVEKLRFVSAVIANDSEATSNKQTASFLAVTGRVYINDTQYFADVPKIAWEFYIGGYQPAQKWLKDRKGRILQFEDILHYQKIIVALKRTSELMKEIDKVLEV